MNNQYRDMGQLARQLAGHAQAVAQLYLPAGQREGHYWLIGDINGRPGRSLRLHLSGPRAGKWRDYATGQHGDLLDLIVHAEKCPNAGAAALIARRFLSEPDRRPAQTRQPAQPIKQRTVARKLWDRARPLAACQADAYLSRRGLTQANRWPALRFLDRALCKDKTGQTHHLPALIAAVTSSVGGFMAVHRTFLDPDQPRQAAIDNPKRLLGSALGGAVRFDNPDAGLLVVGEGIETVLSLLQVMPTWLAGAAALSASHLSGFEPGSYRQVIIAADPDPAGRQAATTLQERLHNQGRAVCIIEPPAGADGDFNDILQKAGPRYLWQYLYDFINSGHLKT